MSRSRSTIFRYEPTHAAGDELVKQQPKSSAAEPAGKKALIIARAAEVFARSGYDGASIGDIARAVGLSKPALYHYFRDKQEIFIHIVVNVVRDMALNVERELEGVADPIEQLRIFVRQHAAFVHENFNACAVAQPGFRDLRDPDSRASAIEWRDRYENCLRRICEAAQKSGAIAVQDVRVAARMVLSLLNWMIVWYRPAGRLSATQIADAYLELLLDGFRPRPRAHAGASRPKAKAKREK
jgi:AcrR family transcriptional regulator